MYFYSYADTHTRAAFYVVVVVIVYLSILCVQYDWCHTCPYKIRIGGRRKECTFMEQIDQPINQRTNKRPNQWQKQCKKRQREKKTVLWITRSMCSIQPINKYRKKVCNLRCIGGNEDDGDRKRQKPRAN